MSHLHLGRREERRERVRQAVRRGPPARRGRPRPGRRRVRPRARPRGESGARAAAGRAPAKASHADAGGGRRIRKQADVVRPGPGSGARRRRRGRRSGGGRGPNDVVRLERDLEHRPRRQRLRGDGRRAGEDVQLLRHGEARQEARRGEEVEVRVGHVGQEDRVEDADQAPAVGEPEGEAEGRVAVLREREVRRRHGDRLVGRRGPGETATIRGWTSRQTTALARAGTAATGATGATDGRGARGAGRIASGGLYPPNMPPYFGFAFHVGIHTMQYQIWVSWLINWR